MSTATQAQAIAERVIRGTLTQTTYTDEVQYLRLASRYLFLDHHPLTSITSITVGDTTLTAADDDGYLTDRFYVLRKYGYVWPADTKITITYKTGWATAGDYPSEITEALAALETWLGDTPHSGLTRTQVDDIVEVRDATSREVPSLARELLSPWARSSL